MRSGHILFSAVHFFVVLFILSLGVFFLAFPYADAIRFQIAHLIESEPGLFKTIGLFVLGFGALLFFGFTLLNKRRFLTIQMGPSKVLVDETIIHDYVTLYWKKFLPENDISVDIVVQKGQKLEIIVPIPKNWEGETKDHLEKIQTDLGDLLARRLGYKREFYLTLAD